jgi:hypothetical protein
MSVNVLIIVGINSVNRVVWMVRRSVPRKNQEASSTLEEPKKIEQESKKNN